jgi:hypothetical protein
LLIKEIWIVWMSAAAAAAGAFEAIMNRVSTTPVGFLFTARQKFLRLQNSALTDSDKPLTSL